MARATISLTVDTPPTGLTAADVDGVTDLVVGDDVVRATCTEPTAKVAVIDAVRAAGSAVLDVETREMSLEDLFTEYTHADEATVAGAEVDG